MVRSWLHKCEESEYWINMGGWIINLSVLGGVYSMILHQVLIKFSFSNSYWKLFSFLSGPCNNRASNSLFSQCAKERLEKKGGLLLFYDESWDKSLSKLRNKIWRFHPTGYFPVLWFDNMVGKKKVVSFFIFSYFPTKIIIKKKRLLWISHIIPIIS